MATTAGGLPYPVGTDKVVDGDDAIKALALAIDPRLTPGVWSGYVPVWTGSTSNPTVGTGTIGGRYLKWGRLCHFVINMVVGTGAGGGAGAWAWSLPLPPAPANIVDSVVFGWINAAANSFLVVGGRIVGGDQRVTNVVDGPGAQLIAGYPLTQGARLYLQGSYETAT